MWKEWELENRQRDVMPRKCKESGGEEDLNYDGITADLERMGEE